MSFELQELQCRILQNIDTSQIRVRGLPGHYFCTRTLGASHLPHSRVPQRQNELKNLLHTVMYST